jgi:hypothetical protein
LNNTYIIINREQGEQGEHAKYTLGKIFLEWKKRWKKILGKKYIPVPPVPPVPHHHFLFEKMKKQITTF